MTATPGFRPTRSTDPLTDPLSDPLTDPQTGPQTDSTGRRAPDPDPASVPARRGPDAPRTGDTGDGGDGGPPGHGADPTAGAPQAASAGAGQPSGTHRGPTRGRAPRAVRAAGAGAGVLGLLLVLAALVHVSAVTRLDLRVDRAVQPLRSAGATDVFRWLTDSSAEAVGVAALVVGVGVLVLRGRRLAATRLLVTAGAAWSFALVLKALVDRPRPPASLWVQPPDNSGSFPSGHDTTATLLLVIVVSVLAGTGRLRRAGAALAVLFAIAVGFGRVYLGDHYPTDILGSYLTVAAVVLLVLAVFDLPPVRRRLAAVGLRDGQAPMSWRGRSSDAACPCPAAHTTHSPESVPASARPHGHPRGVASTTGRADTSSTRQQPAAPRRPRR